MSTQIIIRQVLEDWRERFESVDLPDPDKSIEEIVSNVIGKREVKALIIFLSKFKYSKFL